MMGKSGVRWPLLDDLLKKQQISYVDYALADHLLCGYDASESIAAFLCHLSIATRAGHLCIKIHQNEIDPLPQQLWLENGEANAPSVSWHFLNDLIIEGSKRVPKQLLTDVADELTPPTPICQCGSRFYLQRYWYYERTIISRLKSILNDEPTIALNVNQTQIDPSLLPEQVSAIHTACQKTLTIICGGPGTGKTYTAGQLIRVCWELMDSEQRQRCEIALAAPTGKAAANLQRSLAHAATGMTGFPQIKAKTLHALLGLRGSSRRYPDEMLTADIIIIDESSMIDVRMMAALLSSIKPGARLILLGDPHQLPPVSAGSLFADFIAYLSRVNNPQAIVLKQCLRAELRALIDFASAIKEGNSQAMLTMLSTGASGVSRLCLDTPQALLAHAAPFFQVRNQEPKQLLEAFNHFRILSPLRQGPYGVEALNQRFAEHFMKEKRREGWCAMPIMLVTNDYRLELFNGEVGILIRRLSSHAHTNDQHVEDYALFNQDGIRKIPALLLPKYEYAYCISVHKSQGSEFDHVLLVMPEGAEVFGREVLYTAVTRARKQLEVWGSDKTLSATVSTHSRRLSGFEATSC